jgi:hypothetical protein
MHICRKPPFEHTQISSFIWLSGLVDAAVAAVLFLFCFEYLFNFFIIFFLLFLRFTPRPLNVKLGGVIKCSGAGALCGNKLINSHFLDAL